MCAPASVVSTGLRNCGKFTPRGECAAASTQPPVFPMTERIDCAVIGAGVVGLAIARELALAGREVLVLEAEHGIGERPTAARGR